MVSHSNRVGAQGGRGAVSFLDLTAPCTRQRQFSAEWTAVALHREVAPTSFKLHVLLVHAKCYGGGRGAAQKAPGPGFQNESSP